MPSTSSSSDPVTLLLRHGQTGGFSVPSISGYANESELQQILFEHPDLVPGVTQPAVACREFQSGVGPADVLILQATGDLVVTECKLAQNPQVRREIVGQVIDYASRLWQMPIDEFERRWLDRTGSSPFAEFGDQAAMVRDSLEQRLQSGQFTVVLAVDGINDDLRRMVEYLNAVTLPETQVLAFEVARVADQGVEILLPRVFGAELIRAKSAPSSQPSWSPAHYLEWLGANAPELEPAMRALLGQAEAYGLRIGNGTATSPSVMIGIPSSVGAPSAGALWAVSLYTEPLSVQVRVYQVRRRYDVVAAEAMVNILAKIVEIDPVVIRSEDFRKRVDMPAALFADAESRRWLLQALVMPGGTDGFSDED